jgi:hypothetical protein
MPENLFTITTTPPSSLKLEVGQSGKFSFTVTNLAAPDQSKDVMLQALLVSPQGKKAEVDWLVPGPARTLTMVGGKTETVTITAKPTASSPLGDNTIELAIADKENPNDAYVYSSPVTCQVAAKAGATPPPPSSFPKWLIPVIIGGVLVLGGAAFAIWKFVLSGAPELGEACKPGDAEPCSDNLVCSADGNTCKLPAGAACTDAALCDGGECVGGLCALRLGGACDPATASTVPCPNETHCDDATKTCLKNVCKAGDLQCTADGKSLSTCQDNGTWKTEPCPPNASACRDGKCQCSPDAGKTCNCSGKIQCDGSCSAKPCTSTCTSDGKCCSANAGLPCGKCNGVTKCDGSCSEPTPLDLGKPCGKCKGIMKCDGCSVKDPPRLGETCGECNGTILCSGACSNTTPRCPTGFVIEPPNQCRSTKPIALPVRTLTVPARCPSDTEQTIAQSCGAGRVQGAVAFKSTGATGRCEVRFATNTPTDCSLRVRLVQAGRPAPFGVCLTAKCEITVTTFQRRAQCVK